VDSGFTPGKDDFEFPNNGSMISPRGECAGQSVSMMWYYTNKRQKEHAPALYGLYDNNGRDKTPQIYGDDVLAYRLASVVQNDINWDYHEARYWNMTKNESGLTQFNCFKYAILLTGEPQYVGIFRKGGGHAIVCYRVEGNTLYVADPNYPGKARTIVLTGDKLGPYSSGDNAQDISTNGVYVYNWIYYFADSVLIPEYGLPARWAELKAGTIGDDQFPIYYLDLTFTGPNGTSKAVKTITYGKNDKQREMMTNFSQVYIAPSNSYGTALALCG
jgi:hypothetical protein